MEKNKTYYLTQYSPNDPDTFMKWTKEEIELDQQNPEDWSDEEIVYEITVNKILKINKVAALKITEL